MSKKKKNRAKDVKSKFNKEMEKLYNEFTPEAKAHADYVGRFWSEYESVCKRIGYIEELIAKKATYNMTCVCTDEAAKVCKTPVIVLQKQRDVMLEYARILKFRAMFEDIPL